jgi:hypothetical protein
MLQVQVLTSFKYLRNHCKDPFISEALFQHSPMKGFLYLVNNCLPYAQPLSGEIPLLFVGDCLFKYL